jgi:phenylpropionate dioxygenase-like ring-hydroxylating dioxygenase large terminal subunit
MNSQQALEIIERLRRNLRDGGKDLGERVEMRPSSEYTDPAVFAAEQAHLFRRLPLLIGHASQAPNPGDFFTVNFTGLALLIVCQSDGTLKAFINACRHRGSLLTSADAGHENPIICPYHGWRYELDGRLANITAKDCFPQLDPGQLQLTELPLEVVEGLIFIVATPGAPLQAREWLGPITALLRGFDLASHQHYRTEIIENRFNWKIGVEGALETYHFRYLHSKTVAGLFTGMASIYDHWAPHQRQCVTKPTLSKFEQLDEPIALLRDQVLQTYFIFPCTLISVTNDHMLLTFFYPNGIGGCTMVYTLLTPANAATAANSAHWERTWKLTRTVLAEDFAVQEGIQRAAAAGNASPVVIGLYEQGLARFRAAIDREMIR